MLNLAKEAGLKVDDGIVVNERLETSVPDIYAAGDAANFFHAGLGKRGRAWSTKTTPSLWEKSPGAIWQAGTKRIHTSRCSIPICSSWVMKRSGKTSSKMETDRGLAGRTFKKGVVYYMDEGRVRGVLLWNVWEKVDEARALMMEKGPFKAEGFEGKDKG